MRSVRRAARRSAIAAGDLAPVRTATAALARQDRGRRDRLAILTYHRVDTPDDDAYPGIVSATPDAFAQQMAWLADGYHPIALSDLLARLDGGPALPRRAVMVTFDDAYACFPAHAWPAMRALGVPATMFVPTAYAADPGLAFWWDRLYRSVVGAAADGAMATPLGPVDLRTMVARRRSFRGLRDALKAMPHVEAMAALEATLAQLGERPGRVAVLGWDALRSLSDQGVAMGVHSRTHPLLPRLPVDELDGEIAGSRDDLQGALGAAAAPAIAYPNGDHSPAVLGAVVRAGLRLGFATTRGTNDLRRPDWLAMRRINVGHATGQAALQAQVHGWLDRWT